MCVLRVTGRSFDVDLHLAQSGLNAYKVFRAGEPRFSSRPEGKRYELSGFTVDVSRHLPHDLPAQITDAVAFLKKYERDITHLRSAPGVDDMRLDFPVELRIDRRTVMAQFDYFPPQLVSLAGTLGLGLELSIYPPDLEAVARARSVDRQELPTEATEDGP